MDISSSPYVHKKSSNYVSLKKQIKFELLKTIKLGEFMLLYVEHKNCF